jgi:hypothetical protein
MIFATFLDAYKTANHVDNVGGLYFEGHIDNWAFTPPTGGFYIDNISVADAPSEPRPLPGSIFGAVTLQSRTDAYGLATFELREPGSTIPIPEYAPPSDKDGVTPGVQLILPSDGTYSLPGINPGTYDLAVKVSGFLSQTQAGVVVPSDGSVEANFNLRAGDVTGDNRVNILDLNALKTNYGKSGSP